MIVCLHPQTYITVAGWIIPWCVQITAQALVSSLKCFTQHMFPFPWLQNPVWFFSLGPISLWKCNIQARDSHSALLMYFSIGGRGLVMAIWAPRSNWYPTGYYGCLLIGWWRIDWLIAWKTELWTWWARQQTQENTGKMFARVHDRKCVVIAEIK